MPHYTTHRMTSRIFFVHILPLYANNLCTDLPEYRGHILDMELEISASMPIDSIASTQCSQKGSRDLDI